MKLETLKKRLKGFGRVSSMASNSGGSAPNQFLIKFDNGEVFQSYDSIVGVKINNKVYLTKYWNYSVTTGKYRNQFLGETIADTRKKIESNEYKMVED